MLKWRLITRSAIMATIPHLGALLERSKVHQIGQKMVAEITARTRRGRSVQNRPFRQYSKAYADKKKGGARRPVTLSDTGAMLRSVHVERPTTRSFRITVGADQRGKAIGHNEGAGRVPKRAWFGISQRGQQLFFDDVRAELHRLIRRGGTRRGRRRR